MVFFRVVGPITTEIYLYSGYSEGLPPDTERVTSRLPRKVESVFSVLYFRLLIDEVRMCVGFLFVCKQMFVPSRSIDWKLALILLSHTVRYKN